MRMFIWQINILTMKKYFLSYFGEAGYFLVLLIQDAFTSAIAREKADIS